MVGSLVDRSLKKMDRKIEVNETPYSKNHLTISYLENVPIKTNEKESGMVVEPFTSLLHKDNAENVTHTPFVKAFDRITAFDGKASLTPGFFTSK